MAGEARRAAEAAARASYGRLLAATVRRTRDIAAAEDALADAFRAAVEQWPATGVPDRPEAWLLTVARRAHGRDARRRGVAEAAADTLAVLADGMGEDAPDGFPDRRLALMFVCAHPALDRAVHTPLMLQAVLGLDAARIAAAFLAAPATVGQRLVRAKAKIRDAGIAFAVPEPDRIADRLDAVLDAVYVAYGASWDDVTGADPKRRGLAAEALYLARLLAELCPDQPETHGLLALILYCEARAAARRVDGAFVPIDRQDIALWSRPMIAEAEGHLRHAAAAARFGRFQTEAAIQSLHVEARVSGRGHDEALILFYDLLAQHRPSLGVAVARAAAYGRRSPADGLALLDGFAGPAVAAYQPYWATRAHLERLAGRDAAASYARAIGLSDDPAVRRFLADAGAAGG